MKTTTILVHPRVIQAITGALRKRKVRREALRDAIASVLLRVLEWQHRRPAPLPTDPERAAALCSVFAARWCVSEIRKRTAKKRDAASCKEELWSPLVEPSPDQALEVQRKLEVVYEVVRSGAIESAAEIALAVGEGRTVPEMARNLGLRRYVVKNRLQSLRELCREKVAHLENLAAEPSSTSPPFATSEVGRNVG